MGNSITLEGVSAGYGAVHVLHDVSLTVPSGETVVLLGTNGNGKSTLIRCILGQVRPSAGRLTAEIDGVTHDLIGKSTEDIVDLGIGVVPEGRRLFPRLSVEENLLLGAYRAKARPDLRRNLEFCYECFPRLAERKRQLAGSMSGGEQQMVALGRALVSKPELLILDEPSLGLAPIVVEEVFATIRRVTAEGMTVLLAEQNMQQALALSAHGYVIADGSVVLSGTGEELLASESVREAYLGGA